MQKNGPFLKRKLSHCNTLQRTATHCSTMQHNATRCNTLQHNSTPCNNCNTVTHCNTIYTLTCCNTLQHCKHTATQIETQHFASHECTATPNVATHCNTLQHAATLHHAATHTANTNRHLAFCITQMHSEAHRRKPRTRNHHASQHHTQRPHSRFVFPTVKRGRERQNKHQKKSEIKK